MNELKSTLLKQKYTEKLNESGIHRAMNLDLNTLRSKHINIITYVSTHNPQNPKLFNVIKSNLHMLREDLKMNEILSTFMSMVSMMVSF